MNQAQQNYSPKFLNKEAMYEPLHQITINF